MTEIELPSDSKRPSTSQPQATLGEPSSSFQLYQQTVPVEPYYDLPDDDDLLPTLQGGSGSSVVAATAADAAADELPPQYSALPPSRLDTDPLGPAEPFPESVPRRSFTNSDGDVQYYMDPRLDTDANYLQKWLTHQAAYPPRPFVRIEGSHQETTFRRDSTSSPSSNWGSDREGGGHHNHHNRHHGSKTETKRVTDFDVRIELTPFLYSNIERRQGWRNVRTADNFEKVHRGTVFATRATGFGGDGLSGGGGLGTTSSTAGSLKEWCHVFCAASGLKTFRLRRRVQGFDGEWLGPRLETLVRETGYRGRVDVTFPVRSASVDVYSSGWVNEWRMKCWVRWVFYLTLMFLFVWPYLFFCTRKWDVLFIDWEFSRREQDGSRKYVSVSEEGWLRIWEKGIQRAVLGKRQGVLDQRDLSLDDPSTSLASIPDNDRAGFVGAVANAMGVVQRQFGWGGDT